MSRQEEKTKPDSKNERSHNLLNDSSSSATLRDQSDQSETTEGKANMSRQEEKTKPDSKNERSHNPLNDSSSSATLRDQSDQSETTKAKIPANKSNLEDTIKSSNNLSQAPDLNNETINKNQNVQRESDQNTTFQEEINLLRKEIKSLIDIISKLSDKIELQNAIKEIKVDVMKEIKVDVMDAVDKFVKKHKVTLKLSNQETFQDFNNKLDTNEEFRSDFEDLCLTYLDRNNIEKTVRTIIERFMSQNFIMNCNPERSSKCRNKCGLKNTTFCKILFDLVKNWMEGTEEEKYQAFIQILKKIIEDAKRDG